LGIAIDGGLSIEGLLVANCPVFLNSGSIEALYDRALQMAHAAISQREEFP
jgi:hypothetical protein